MAFLAIQHGVGAYVTERGTYSDEASHLLNGLLLRDYLREGLGTSPIQFAQDYYLNYPKIAPGMWPPLFHAVLGILLLFGGTPQATALVFVGAAGAWTSWRLWTIVDRLGGAFVASVATLFFVTTAALIDMTSVVMLDALVAAVMLEATWWLARYVLSGRRQDALVFGVMATLCCLTKGNGIAIVLVPALMAFLAWRPRLLIDANLWLAAAIVLLFAFPVVMFSYRLDAAIGDFGPVTASIAAHRVSFYVTHMARQLGIGITVLGFLAILLVLLRRIAARTADDTWLVASLGSLVLAALTFHMLTPHQVVDSRYMLMALAPMTALAVFTLRAIATAFASRESRAAWCAVLLVAVCASGHALRPRPVTREPLGWRAAVNHLWQEGGLGGQRILVVSDESGEGAFVSEVAIDEPLPRATVIRGSKLLATDDWNGHALRLTFASPKALAQELEDLHVSYVVLDGSPHAQALPYHRLVAATADSDRAILTYSSDGARPIRVYRLKHATPGSAKKLRMAVSGPLSFVSER